jgi:hypothetical protein
MRWKETVGLLLLVAGSALASNRNDVAVTATGWFGDEWCTAARVKAGNVGPPGQDCTRECIRKGAPVMFIDEKRKALFRVDNPEKTRGIESDHIEFVGTMNAEAKTVHVDSVTVKEKYVAKCGKPTS